MKFKSIIKTVLCTAAAIAAAASISSCVMPVNETRDFTAPARTFVVANAPAVSTRKVIISVTITG